MDKNEITRIEMKLWIDAYHGASRNEKCICPESVADGAVERFRQRFDLDSESNDD